MYISYLDLRTWTIVLIVVLAFFLVFDLVALFATGRVSLGSAFGSFIIHTLMSQERLFAKKCYVSRHEYAA